jgi:hypothetical protein
MFVLYNPHTKNPRRYQNDYKLDYDDEEEKYNKTKPIECKYKKIRNCYRKDPVSGVEIPLLIYSADTWICQNCKNKEKIDKWFINLQQTEIPSVLSQFHNLKGRLVYDINDKQNGSWTFGPSNDDKCWQFYSIIYE